ncbi:hypothetical protein D3C80_1529390 [compost metagenome]
MKAMLFPYRRAVPQKPDDGRKIRWRLMIGPELRNTHFQRCILRTARYQKSIVIVIEWQLGRNIWLFVICRN